MSDLHSAAIRRLREAIELPDLSGTRYQLGEAIGRGGMGVVFRAHDRELDRDVALKVLSVRDLGDDARERMANEARILARLEHPGIVPVHDAGVLPDGRVFYAMKLVRGHRLDDHARATQSVPEVLRAFIRTCEAVAFAHSQGIVHRDLKPGNVMVGAFGEVLVMDWGVAKLAGTFTPAASGTSTGVDTDAGTVLGTPGFIAPEQALGQSDPRSDIFALGVMLREIVRAAGSTRVPPRLAAIAGRASAPDPLSRYPDVAALAADVQRYLDAQPVDAYKERWYERALRLAGRHRVALGLVTAYVAMRVLIFFLDRP